MNSDDERLGLLLRAIRRECGHTQEQLAVAAGVPVLDARKVESGRVGDVRVDRVRRLFLAAGGRARLTAWWNGAAADRLLDERHATLAERGASLMAKHSWLTTMEVTYSEFGERGSIDIFGAQPTFRAVVVCEVKSVIGSLEETNRVLDVKERLAPKLCRDRFGWQPLTVSRLLIVPDESTVRRVIERYGQTMRTVYPTRGREVRAWLKTPERGIRGIWFLSNPPISRPISG